MHACVGEECVRIGAHVLCVKLVCEWGVYGIRTRVLVCVGEEF